MSGIEHSSIHIELKRFDRVYRPGDLIEGTLMIIVRDGWSHQGIQLQILGGVYIRKTRSSTAGLLTDFSEDPFRTIFINSINVLDQGRLSEGVTEVPFSFPLEASGASFLETYHGVSISVAYRLIAVCERGLMKRELTSEMEFIVEVPVEVNVDPQARSFEISNATLAEEDVSKSSNASIPTFSFSGNLHRTTCPLNLPFTGDLTIHECEVPLRTVEVQIIRIENISSSRSREVTEIQSIQIAEGDVPRNLTIPIYVVFPRLFTCPTLLSPDFSVEFEANLIFGLENGYTIVESFPLSLHRGL
jgi:hypothetical protein